MKTLIIILILIFSLSAQEWTKELDRSDIKCIVGDAENYDWCYFTTTDDSLFSYNSDTKVSHNITPDSLHGTINDIGYFDQNLYLATSQGVLCQKYSSWELLPRLKGQEVYQILIPSYWSSDIFFVTANTIEQSDTVFFHIPTDSTQASQDTIIQAAITPTNDGSGYNISVNTERRITDTTFKQDIYVLFADKSICHTWENNSRVSKQAIKSFAYGGATHFSSFILLDSIAIQKTYASSDTLPLSIDTTIIQEPFTHISSTQIDYTTSRSINAYNGYWVVTALTTAKGGTILPLSGGSIQQQDLIDSLNKLSIMIDTLNMTTDATLISPHAYITTSPFQTDGLTRMFAYSSEGLYSYYDTPTPLISPSQKSQNNPSLSVKGSILTYSLPKESHSTLSIIDVRGRILYQQNLNQAQGLIPLHSLHLAKGTYILSLKEKSSTLSRSFQIY